MSRFLFFVCMCASLAILSACPKKQDLGPKRVTMPYDAFAAEAGTGVLQHHTHAAFGNAPTWGPVDGQWHACIAGDLTYDGADWPVEVHLLQGDEGVWRVESWAVAPPSPMQKTMLEVCKTAW